MSHIRVSQFFECHRLCVTRLSVTGLSDTGLGVTCFSCWTYFQKFNCHSFECHISESHNFECHRFFCHKFECHSFSTRCILTLRLREIDHECCLFKNHQRSEYILSTSRFYSAFLTISFEIHIKGQRRSEGITLNLLGYGRCQG